MLFWNHDYCRGLAGHMRPATSAVRPDSAQFCWLCHLSSDGLVESDCKHRAERHRSQKICRSSEENRSKWVLFRIAIYRSSGYNPIFCPAISAELPGVLMFWNPMSGHKVPCRACVRIPMYSGLLTPGTAVIHRKYPSSDVNTIDRNIDYRSKFSSMIYDKINVSQNSHESRSVASDGLTKCIQAMVSLNIYKNSANKFGRKIPLFKSNLTLKV